MSNSDTRLTAPSTLEQVAASVVWDLSDIVPKSHPVTFATMQALDRVVGLSASWKESYSSAPDRLEAVEHQLEALRKGVEGNALQQGSAHTMPPQKRREYLDARQQQSVLRFMDDGIGHLYVLGLVAIYDQFVGDMLRAVFDLQPKLLSNLERSIPIRDALSMETPADIRALVIDREVEQLLRLGHVEQLGYFEKLLGLSTLRNWERFPEFVELMERRNLFAHTGGIISSRYLERCTSYHRAPNSAPEIGELLSAGPNYLQGACDLIFSVITMLSQTIWRKLSSVRLAKNKASSEIAAADKVLSRICYTLLVRQQFALVTELLDFALASTIANEHDRRVFTINRAQAAKWQGKHEECDAVLEQEDWSASGISFRLGLAVLQDRFDEAETLMRLASSHGEIPQHAFDEWPLFNEFRSTPQFARAYASCFERPAS